MTTMTTISPVSPVNIVDAAATVTTIPPITTRDQAHLPDIYDLFPCICVSMLDYYTRLLMVYPVTDNFTVPELVICITQCARIHAARMQLIAKARLPSTFLHHSLPVLRMYTQLDQRTNTRPHHIHRPHRRGTGVGSDVFFPCTRPHFKPFTNYAIEYGGQ